MVRRDPRSGRIPYHVPEVRRDPRSGRIPYRGTHAVGGIRGGEKRREGPGGTHVKFYQNADRCVAGGNDYYGFRIVPHIDHTCYKRRIVGYEPQLYERCGKGIWRNAGYGGSNG